MFVVAHQIFITKGHICLCCDFCTGINVCDVCDRKIRASYDTKRYEGWLKRNRIDTSELESSSQLDATQPSQGLKLMQQQNVENINAVNKATKKKTAKNQFQGELDFSSVTQTHFFQNSNDFLLKINEYMCDFHFFC